MSRIGELGRHDDVDRLGEQAADRAEAVQRSAAGEDVVAGNRGSGDVALDDRVVGFAARQQPGVFDAAFGVTLAELDAWRPLLNGVDDAPAEPRILAVLWPAGERERVLAPLHAPLDVLRRARELLGDDLVLLWWNARRRQLHQGREAVDELLRPRGRSGAVEVGRGRGLPPAPP